MGCCGSASDVAQQQQSPIQKPFVTRSSARPVPPGKANLPKGVLLTGGARFRETNLLGQGVKVAVIDSGVDKDHPAFDGKVVHQTWYRKGTPLLEDDHGTHVAGTIHFMAPEAQIYDYRVFGKDGNLGVDQAIAQAIYDCIDKQGCHIINMSLGGPYPNPLIQEAVKYAHSKGVILVCAAGNSGDNDPLTNEIGYPASFPQCISVAAVSKADGLPVAVFSNSNAEVDYAGIGVDVVSMQPGGTWQTMSGTSMACPHVCGLIAAILSNGRIVNKGKQTDKILRDALNSTYVVDIDQKGRDNNTGLGFLTALDETNFRRILQSVGTTMATVH